VWYRTRNNVDLIMWAVGEEAEIQEKGAQKIVAVKRRHISFQK
jgi:hypothetical protein